MAYIAIQFAGDAAPNGIRNSACPRARSATLVSAPARPPACAVDSTTDRKESTWVARPVAMAAAPSISVPICPGVSTPLSTHVVRRPSASRTSCVVAPTKPPSAWTGPG